jgi:hypothetical protein
MILLKAHFRLKLLNTKNVRCKFYAYRSNTFWEKVCRTLKNHKLSKTHFCKRHNFNTSNCDRDSSKVFLER